MIFILKGQSKVIHNYYSVKQYGSDYFRLVCMKVPMVNGWDPDYIPPRDVNEFKLDESIIRSRRTIFEIAMCNDFEMFITLTLNKDKHDRYDLEKFIESLGQFLSDYKKRKGCKIERLLIPEEHKDRAWHMHGLIKGIPMDHLVKYTLQDNIPEEMKKMIRSGRKLYWWPPYQERFGYMSMEPIKNKIAVSKYITKYIAKSIDIAQADSSRKNKRLFYPTHGLKRAVKIREGTIRSGIIPSDQPIAFDNEYCTGYELTRDQYEVLMNKLPSDIIIPYN